MTRGHATSGPVVTRLGPADMVEVVTGFWRDPHTTLASPAGTSTARSAQKGSAS